ncbi:hypothetical protein MMC18_003514 [Xylographa bjoerkii]|nr:hypothetical protein [Xylographa bjoerkii]
MPISVAKNVVIVGGSLSGLIHGIMLTRAGSRVTVLEQSPASSLRSHMAGVCCGPDVLWFLDKYDLLSHLPLGISSAALQSLDKQGRAKVFLRGARLMTSWDALYYRLRANYDGLASEYYPDPPTLKERTMGFGEEPGESTRERQERAVYAVGKRVTALVDEGDRLRVSYTDHKTGESVEMLADMVLGADGPNSVVRTICGGEAAAQRVYAGYVAWRGVVPEEEVSEETRETFRANITYNMLGEQGHVILYYIPGKDGSLDQGKRYLNFCWYTNVATGAALADIMTDVDGTEHHTSLAPGKVRPPIWERQRKLAHGVFHARYLEVIDKIASPFVHKITDYYSPEAAFMGGKVMLVGDAAALLRPHIAFSTNQAAYQCKLLEKVVKGEMSREEWNWHVTRFTWLHWLRSIWFGEFFQRPWTSIFAALPYWAAAGVERVRYYTSVIPQISR